MELTTTQYYSALQKSVSNLLLYFPINIRQYYFLFFEGSNLTKTKVVMRTLKSTFHLYFTCFLLVLVLIIFNPNKTYAWLYPEHRQIAIIAIQNLSPEYRTTLDQLWTVAGKGYSNRLTDAVIDPAQSTKPSKIDYAAWTAISGDHSCSPQLMLNTVLHTDWILKVADVAAQLKIDLANAKNRSDQINAIRNSDIKLRKPTLRMLQEPDQTMFTFYSPAQRLIPI